MISAEVWKAAKTSSHVAEFHFRANFEISEESACDAIIASAHSNPAPSSIDIKKSVAISQRRERIARNNDFISMSSGFRVSQNIK